MRVPVLLITLCQHAFANDLAVPAIWNLQAALDSAQPGDTITIQAGSVHRGNYVLRPRPGVLPVTVRTSAFSSLPSRRIAPSDVHLLAKIVSPNSDPAIRAASGSGRWRFLGLEISQDVRAYQIVELGSAEAVASDLPHDFDFNQVYIHGDPTGGTKRGVQLNGARITIRNSHLSGFRSTQQETQALAGWNGPGPFDILNNYLEATGMSILFGGATPRLLNVVPSNIRIIGNLLSRPLSWMGHETGVKNLLELKNASDVEIDGNIFENNWAAAQQGRAIVFTVRTEFSQVCWAVVRNVKLTNNIIRNVTAGVHVAGPDPDSGNASCAGSSSDYIIRNNLFLNVGPTPYDKWGYGPLLLLTNGPRRLTFEHNTALQSYATTGMIGPPAVAFVMTNNIFSPSLYGLHGDSVGAGTAALNHYAPGALVAGNLFAGQNASTYPPGNNFPADLAAIGFANTAAGDYALSNASPYRGRGLTGVDPGVNLPALRLATRNVESGEVAAEDGRYELAQLPGPALSVRWTAPSPSPAVAILSDWVGVFPVGVANNASPDMMWPTNGKGTGTIMLAPVAANRELRYIRADGTTAVTMPLSVTVPAVLTPTSPPRIVSLTPSSGTGLGQTFVTNIQESSGHQNLRYVSLIVDQWVKPMNGCVIGVSVGERLVTLLGDSGTVRTSGVAGSAGVLSNSQCAVNLSGVSITTSGQTMTTIVTPITFFARFSGNKSTFVSANNTALMNTGQQTMGSYSVGAPPPPSRGSSVSLRHQPSA